MAVLTTWKSVADYLHVHQDTAEELHKLNGLPIAKIRGYIFTTTGLIELWITSHLPLLQRKQAARKKKSRTVVSL